MYSAGSRYGDRSPRPESEDYEVHSELQISSAHSDTGSIRWRDFTGPGNRIRITSNPNGSQTISFYLAPGVWDPERWHTLRAGQRPPEPTETNEEGNANLQPGAAIERGGSQAAGSGQGGESAQ
jgi:hypothetical protein